MANLPIVKIEEGTSMLHQSSDMMLKPHSNTNTITNSMSQIPLSRCDIYYSMGPPTMAPPMPPMRPPMTPMTGFRPILPTIAAPCPTPFPLGPVHHLPFSTTAPPPPHLHPPHPPLPVKIPIGGLPDIKQWMNESKLKLNQTLALTIKQEPTVIDHPFPVNVSCRDPPFVSCQHCSKTFKTKHGLKNHMYKHTRDWPLYCSVCKKGMASKSRLTMHMRSHTGEKPFKCPYFDCQKGFIKRHDLTRHIRCHTGEKPFSCPACKREFSRASNRDRHISTCASIKEESY